MNAPAGNLLKLDKPLAPSRERFRLRLYLALMLIDAAALYAGFAVIGWVSGGRGVALLPAHLLVPLYWTIALPRAVYAQRALEHLGAAISRALLALALATGLLLFIAFVLLGSEPFAGARFGAAIVLSALIMTAGRAAAVRCVQRRASGQVTNILLIDAGGPAVSIPGAFALNAAEAGLSAVPDDPAALDRLGRALANMDRVVVTCEQAARPDWAQVLRAAGVRGELVSGPLAALQPVGLARYGEVVSLVVSTGPLGLRARAAKRAFDLILAGGALVLLSPLLLLVALAIRLEDGGPALFVQRRMGRHNRLFRMLKFRTMRSEAADGEGQRSAGRSDGRVTRVGRFLRRTSLDELPQLLNVLGGSMSLVGPRPHALGSQAGKRLFWEVDPLYWRRHRLRPGMTGLAQVRGWRGTTETEHDLTQRLAADLEYIETWSLWRDALILARTLLVMTHRNAY